MNVPLISNDVRFMPSKPKRINMVHHGAADKDRQLEIMIDALALTHSSYYLTFILIGDNKYIQKFKRFMQNLMHRAE